MPRRPKPDQLPLPEPAPPAETIAARVPSEAAVQPVCFQCGADWRLAPTPDCPGCDFRATADSVARLAREIGVENTLDKW